MESKKILINEKEEIKPNELKNKFINIKSDYFLSKIFNDMQKKLSL